MYPIRFVLFGAIAVLSAQEIRDTAQTKAADLSTQKERGWLR